MSIKNTIASFALIASTTPALAQENSAPPSFDDNFTGVQIRINVGSCLESGSLATIPVFLRLVTTEEALTTQGYKDLSNQISDQIEFGSAATPLFTAFENAVDGKTDEEVLELMNLSPRSLLGEEGISSLITPEISEALSAAIKDGLITKAQLFFDDMSFSNAMENAMICFEDLPQNDL